MGPMPAHLTSAPLDVSGHPAHLTPVARARLAVATAAGRLAAFASRVAGRGTGTAIRGQVMLTVDPQALAKLLAGRRIAMVSGTNGKTTTTHFLAAAAREALPGQPERIVHNADGANLHGGIASALSTKPSADIAVLETDERVVADVVRLGKPEVLVLLNFSRDQLDRHHEIKALARSWRNALIAAGDDGPVVVANADEPLVVWAAQRARQTIWVDTESSWLQDAVLCPECGGTLARTESESGARWHCQECSLAEPTADFRVSGDKIISPDDQVWDPRLQVPGKFNISNAACALAAASVFRIDAETAIRGMQTVTSPAGRFGIAHFGSTTARLLLAKNPAGWAEALPLVETDTVILAIDSAAADGRDVSWLWDVEYEQLAGKRVIATGPRAQDLAVRLTYAEVDHVCVPDLGEATLGHAEPVDIVATYTPFQRLRKMGGLA
jgi:UDP-N-acetylmuramyl tripeptide synthase